MRKKIKGKTVYLFDFTGEFIQKYVDVKFASSKLNIPVFHIRAAIVRNNIVQNRFYFSYSKDVIIKKAQNPLFTEIKLYNEDADDESVQQLEFKRINNIRLNEWLIRWNRVLKSVRKYNEFRKEHNDWDYS